MRERKINLNDLIPLIKEKLDEGGEVTFSPNGTSMLPTLKAGRDRLILVSPPERLKKYDVALFLRDNGQYVLHRVIKCKEQYTFIGDNQFFYEKNIGHDQIIALCCAYVRDGKRVSLDSFKCRLFARFWHYTRLWRRGYRAITCRVKSLFKK